MFKRIYFGFCFLLFLGVMYTAFITFKPNTKVYPEDVTSITGLPHISKLTYRDSIIFDEIIKKNGEE